MAHRVCPWWLARLLLVPLRRFPHDPRRIAGPYVSEGMIVLEPGPGLGFFTLDLARFVGPSGQVVAVDVQSKLIDGLRRRAEKAGLAGRITCRLASPERLGLDDLTCRADFVLVFAVAHEVEDAGRFFVELEGAMKPGARLLLAEPRLHVGERDFAASLTAALGAGLQEESRPRVPRCRAALLRKA